MKNIPSKHTHTYIPPSSYDSCKYFFFIKPRQERERERMHVQFCFFFKNKFFVNRNASDIQQFFSMFGYGIIIIIMDSIQFNHNSLWNNNNNKMNVEFQMECENFFWKLICGFSVLCLFVFALFWCRYGSKVLFFVVVGRFEIKNIRTCVICWMDGYGTREFIKNKFFMQPLLSCD